MPTILYRSDACFAAKLSPLSQEILYVIIAFRRADKRELIIDSKYIFLVISHSVVCFIANFGLSQSGLIIRLYLKRELIIDTLPMISTNSL